MLAHTLPRSVAQMIRQVFDLQPLVTRSQQGPLRRIWSLGALGEGSGWDLRILPAQAASGNLGTWKSGILGIWRSGNPECLRFGDLEIQNLGIPKIKKMKSLKNQIRSAQNVGKVWISRKKIILALFGAIWGHFLHGPKKSKKCKKKMPISPVWGPCCYPPGVGK